MHSSSGAFRSSLVGYEVNILNCDICGSLSEVFSTSHAFHLYQSGIGGDLPRSSAATMGILHQIAVVPTLILQLKFEFDTVPVAQFQLPGGDWGAVAKSCLDLSTHNAPCARIATVHMLPGFPPKEFEPSCNSIWYFGTFYLWAHEAQWPCLTLPKCRSFRKAARTVKPISH